MMGYGRIRRMSDEDVYSLVAYLNTLTPVRNRVPRSQIAFPVSPLMKSAPRPAGHVPEPDRSNKVKYGEYLVTVAGCVECHSPAKMGKPLKGLTLAGGEEFRFPGAMVCQRQYHSGPANWNWTLERTGLSRSFLPIQRICREGFAVGWSRELHADALAEFRATRTGGPESHLRFPADAAGGVPRGGFASGLAGTGTKAKAARLEGATARSHVWEMGRACPGVPDPYERIACSGRTCPAIQQAC
jgi:hypothetical protein